MNSTLGPVASPLPGARRLCPCSLFTRLNVETANMTTPSSQALAKRNADTQLMPPPPPTKRIKRPSQVVDEDVYTDALSHIIARDYFPGLLESQAQQEYLEALGSNNNDWIRDAGRKLHQAMTPGPRARRGTSLAPSATPRGWHGTTPTRTPSVAPSAASSSAETSKPPIDTSLSLGAFQAKYTSEDNESFNSLLDRQNQKRAEKYAFFYNGNKLPSKQQLAQQKLLSSVPSQSTALVTRPSQNLDDRSASFDSFPSRQGPRNTLMFAPEGVEDTHQTQFDRAQAVSVAPPKSVSYTSTRMPVALSEDPQIPPSPSMSAIDAAIAGRPRPSSTDAGYSGAETPRVKGYAFVDAEPLPHEIDPPKGVPVSDAEADAEERASAMALLPAADPEAANNPFKLQAQSKREEIHHRLVEKSNMQRRKPTAGSRLSALKGQDGRTPTPRFTSSPAIGRQTPGANMTPAARLLASRIGGRTPGRTDTLFGSQQTGDRSSRVWTPTPRVKKSTG
jgi:protein DGCR14